MNKKYYSVEKRIELINDEIIRHIKSGDLYNVDRYMRKLERLYGNTITETSANHHKHPITSQKILSSKYNTACMNNTLLLLKEALLSKGSVLALDILAILQELVEFGFRGMVLYITYKIYTQDSNLNDILLSRMEHNQNSYYTNVLLPVCIAIKDKDYYGFLCNNFIELHTLPNGLKFAGYLNRTNNMLTPASKCNSIIDILCNRLYILEESTIISDNISHEIKIDDIIDIEYKELPTELKKFYNPIFSFATLLLENNVWFNCLIADYNAKPDIMRMELKSPNKYAYRVVVDDKYKPIRLEKYGDDYIDYTDPKNGTAIITYTKLEVPANIVNISYR